MALCKKRMIVNENKTKSWIEKVGDEATICDNLGKNR